jgi:hypothetical protein
VHDVEVVVQEAPPGLAVTVYRVIGEPRSAGAFHESVTWPPLALTPLPLRPVGATGAPITITDELVAAVESPAALIALTDNV